MSDRQTTAVVILVFLSLAFYLYNQGRLGKVVSSITGAEPASPATATNTIAGIAAGIADNQSVVSGASYTTNIGGSTGSFLNAVLASSQAGASSTSGSSSGLPGTLAAGASLGATVATILPFLGA